MHLLPQAVLTSSHLSHDSRFTVFSPFSRHPVLRFTTIRELLSKFMAFLYLASSLLMNSTVSNGKKRGHHYGPWQFQE
jgi:hypothetical protein